MSETLVGLPATTTRTALNATDLDEEVGAFPAAVRLSKESGVPLVWAYDSEHTSVLLVVEGQSLAAGRVAARGLLRCRGLAEPWPNRHEMTRALDDRWRIDLRTPIGFGFALRWLINQPPLLHLGDDMVWRHVHLDTTDSDRLALARAIETVLGPVGGEE